ncbi:hypothetical protein SLEP1_g45744 [Rubroshorea leprosula]|uniref:RRM domain-containing protein n=1 Tax=Rubroshorea leprosula TaxID=152421 RepID=A0AAV5LKT6_9ROSI|nr:hypothetical protein SLEP1_g45744 [Rubroshorea leprosula]
MDEKKGKGIMAAKPKSFKIHRKSSLASKLKSSISAQLLRFLGHYSDDVLAEYITVLVCNGKHQYQARDDLEAFLGERSGEFVSWLWEYLSRYAHQVNEGTRLFDSIDVTAGKDYDNDEDKEDSRFDGLKKGDKTKDEKIHLWPSSAGYPVLCNDLESAEGFQHLAGFSTPPPGANDKSLPQTCRSEILGKVSATGDIDNNSLTYNSSVKRSPVISARKKQNFQHLEMIRKIVQSNNNALPKTEVFLRDLQSLISEYPTSRQTCATKVSGSGLSLTSVGAISRWASHLLRKMQKASDSDEVDAKRGNEKDGCEGFWKSVSEKSQSLREEWVLVFTADIYRRINRNTLIDSRLPANPIFNGRKFTPFPQFKTLIFNRSSNFHDQQKQDPLPIPILIIIDSYIWDLTVKVDVEYPTSRQTCATKVSGSGLSLTSVGAVSLQNEKPRGSVWDRLGKPCEDISASSRVTKLQDACVWKQEVLAPHTPIFPLWNGEVGLITPRQVSSLGNGSGGSNTIKSRMPNPGASAICQQLTGSNIRGKRHFEEISTCPAMDLVSSASEKNVNSQCKEASQDLKKPNLITKNLITSPNLISEVLDVKQRLCQVEIEMLKVRAKQLKKENDGKATLSSNSGSMKHPNGDIDSRTVFVSNVHFAATKQALVSYFNKCGVVVNAVILTDKDTCRPKGSAYVTFATKESVDKAIALSGSTFLLRTVKVQRKAEATSASSAMVARARCHLSRTIAQANAAQKGVVTSIHQLPASLESQKTQEKI